MKDKDVTNINDEKIPNVGVDFTAYDAEENAMIEVKNMPLSVAVKMIKDSRGETFRRIAQDVWNKRSERFKKENAPFVYLKNVYTNEVMGISWKNFLKDFPDGLLEGSYVLCDYAIVDKITDNEEEHRLMYNLWGLIYGLNEKEAFPWMN